jgi:hypothetical protein
MTTYKSRFDSISIFVSALCVIHCILLPIFLTTLPLWGFEVMENIWIESGTILISLVAGGWAIWRGYVKHHQRLFIPLLFIAGLSLMITANLIKNEKAEMVLKGAGALLVIVAHVVNWRVCRRCVVCEN